MKEVVNSCTVFPYISCSLSRMRRNIVVVNLEKWNAGDRKEGVKIGLGLYD